MFVYEQQLHLRVKQQGLKKRVKIHYLSAQKQ